MTDVTYEIQTDGLGTLTAEKGVTNVQNITVGETTTLELRQVEVAVDSDVLTVTSAITIPGDEEFTQVNVSGGSLDTLGGTVNVTNSAQSGHMRLRQLTQYAGAYSLTETLDTTVRFRQQLPSGLPFNSLVIKATPSQDIQDRGMEAFYGILSSGSDERPLPLNRYPFTLELDVLALGDDYSDIAELKNNLEI